MSTIRLNGKALVDLGSIKLIKALDDEERARIEQQYGTADKPFDASGFTAKVEYTRAVGNPREAGLPVLIRDSLDDLRLQAPFINAGYARFVPAENIVGAGPLEDKDRTDVTSDKVWRSKIATKGGPVWSAGTDEQVMDRKAKAIAEFKPQPRQGDAAPSADKA